MKTILITGSGGLIGSACVQYFLEKKWQVVGIDNDSRAVFFGAPASTQKNVNQFKKNKQYFHLTFDIRDSQHLGHIFQKYSFDAIIHTAAQPSHDKAKEIPLVDFEINASATLHLLELTRTYCPSATFVFTSTNKVYGDNPNQVALRETPTRYDFISLTDGIDEAMSIDNTTHSLFGCSKAAADVYVQEYARYFGMHAVALRLGCVTGSSHASVKLHGFLSFLIKTVLAQKNYEIIGYKGKQVRDQIDAVDVASAAYQIISTSPKDCVYNLGGGKENAASILEILALLKNKTGISAQTSYTSAHRTGDHICYYTNLSKFRRDYPKWKLTKNLDTIIEHIIEYETKT